METNKPLTLEEAKKEIASQSHYKTWANIVDEFHGTDDYPEYLEKAAILAISNLQVEIEVLRNQLGAINDITFGTGSHQERIGLIKNALNHDNP